MSTRPSVADRMLRYGLAVLVIAVALGLALFAETYGITQLEFGFFLIAIAAAVWYAGSGPGLLAIMLAGFCFDFFFTEPKYSLQIRLEDQVYFGVFVMFALLISVFAARRRRIEHELRLALDQLKTEVALRTQQADEIRQLNVSLERRSAELEVSNKELEAFAYSTSHDLRAPLRHVSGYSELLQKNASAGLDEKGRRYVTMIVESADKMGRLIDDLLSFSRIGRAEKLSARVDLQDLLDDVMRDISRDAGEREIAWKVGRLPRVHGDRSMLRIVLVNLLSNAVKYTRTREKAEIEIGCTDQNDQEVVVFVKDNGVGFDMKYVGKLFGVFQRLHRSNQFEGTGIGLATVQRIVARHGGRAWAEGVVNGGATFYFSAPKLREEA